MNATERSLNAATRTPALIDRTREIRSVLDVDAGLRTEGMTQPREYARSLRRDSIDETRRCATVGEIEQYRAAYDINSNRPLGPRPAYDDMARVDQYRRVDHNLNQLTLTRGRDRGRGMGIER